MASPFLLYIYGPVPDAIILITVVIAVYSIAKAVMRNIDNHKKK